MRLLMGVVMAVSVSLQAQEPNACGGASPAEILRELVAEETPLAEQTQLAVHGLFTDGMVLQRGVPVPVWGWAAPGTEVTVAFAGQKKHAVADSSNHWKISLDPLSASSKPREMVVSSAGVTLRFSDVLVGDVWLCSGQSNMEVTMKLDVKKYPPRGVDIEAAANPLVRFFKVDPASSRTLRRDIPPVRDDIHTPWMNSFLNNRWRPCTKEWAPHVSATAFYFARELQPAIGCPLGILVSARGGTAIDKWVPPELIERDTCWENSRGKLTEAESDWGRFIEPYVQEWSAFKKTYPDLHTLWLAQKEDRTIRPPQQAVWPSCFYNGMIHPLAPFAVKGVLWYQGEGDNGNAAPYTDKMVGMINAWRKLWKVDDLPFIITQIAPFDKYHHGNGPKLRAAQARVPGLLADTYMATLIDAGMRKNIHPVQKDIAGRRLALVALDEVYGKPVEAYGPTPKAVERKNGKLLIGFDHAEGGLHAKGVDLDGTHLPAGVLEGFEICGPDRTFVKAEARMVGKNQVLLSAKQVSDPLAVRYAWANFPLANLYNGAGLPAAPFRAEVENEK